MVGLARRVFVNDRFKVVPAVYLVLVNDNKVLLSLRKNTGFADGQYSLVAGHIEGNETMTSAMIREAREEVGLTLEQNEILMKSVIHRKSDDRESVDFFFLCHKDFPSPQNMEPMKCAEVKFFHLNQLPTNLIPYVKQGILNCLNGVAYSEAGW